MKTRTFVFLLGSKGYMCEREKTTTQVEVPFGTSSLLERETGLLRPFLQGKYSFYTSIRDNKKNVREEMK